MNLADGEVKTRYHRARKTTFRCQFENSGCFKNYVREKNKLNAEIRDFYGLALHRKMNTQRSEDRFHGRMRGQYGRDALLAYGDWSRRSQMKHFVPTRGVGMRRLISRHFETASINEFRTSKLSCNCEKELSYWKFKQEGKK